MPVNLLPSPTESEDVGPYVGDLATGAMDNSLLDEDVAASVTLPDCEAGDRTISWISQPPASPGDQLTAAL